MTMSLPVNCGTYIIDSPMYKWIMYTNMPTAKTKWHNSPADIVVSNLIQ